jgi:hypothetical protein
MNQSQALQKQTEQPVDTKILEQVITKGDLADLSPGARVSYYNAVCRSLGLNPLTKPFDFLKLKVKNAPDKVILYARKDCTEQLRTNHKISIYKLENRIENDCLVVTAYARTPDGREDIDEGAVYLKGLIGEDAANARMRATTKAKRRVTLSICGLGFLDESEVTSIAGAQRVSDDDITLSTKASGLDQWKCGHKLAMDLIAVCKRLEAAGVNDEQMRRKLPAGVQSRKDLTQAQAVSALEEFRAWLEALDSEIAQGEIVNG